MGRVKTAQADTIICGNAVPTSFNSNQPFSVSCWVDRTGQVFDISFMGTLDTNNNYRGWELQQEHLNLLAFNLISTYPTSYLAVQTTNVIVGGYFNAIATYDGSGVAAGANVFINGVAGQTTLADNLSGNTTTNSIPLRFGSRLDGTDALGATGKLAEAGVWNVLLTANEIAALVQGARCFTIRPKSLVAYLPFFGLASPEPDLSGNANNAALSGTAFVQDPSISMFTPRWRG